MLAFLSSFAALPPPAPPPSSVFDLEVPDRAPRENGTDPKKDPFLSLTRVM